uniref:hypothetical protein n=1 Tax=Salmonella sp. TaxID=599 RepID=UPI001CD9C650|nr:hypothetical protein [Salmonella sp.]
MSWDQISATSDYPSVVSDEVAAMIRFADKQREKRQRARYARCADRQLINKALDLRNLGANVDDKLADVSHRRQQKLRSMDHRTRLLNGLLKLALKN